MKIAIASDHAGFKYKEEIKKFLGKKGHEVKDFGTNSEESCDYPDFIFPAAQSISKGDSERAIVLGGSGNGEAIVANKAKGVRCTLCWSEESAKLARLHNDSNCLSLGQRMMSLETALKIVEIWLRTEFEGGRHAVRIQKIADLEKR
ncbi:ribose 5-phosphate isomerase B [Candidatus Peregrinibacteria bacterium]|nr:ribose 5-phosphate isomerase B [Candidatus Peregrinibacteria bacterium]